MGGEGAAPAAPDVAEVEMIEATPPTGMWGWLLWELDNICKLAGRAAGAGMDPMAT